VRAHRCRHSVQGPPRIRSVELHARAGEEGVRDVTLSGSPQPLTLRSKRCESSSVFWAVSRRTSHLFTC
jgi:hypothetical protein